MGEKAKTLGELVRLRMGQKVLDNLVAPVVSGVYSTHPDKLDVDATIPGLRVTLLEQRPHLGGAVGAHEVGGLLLDSGAESFATRSPIVRELVEELGLGDQIVTPNSYGSWLYLPQGACRTPSTGIMGIPGNVSDKSLIPVIGKSCLLYTSRCV